MTASNAGPGAQVTVAAGSRTTGAQMYLQLDEALDGLRWLSSRGLDISGMHCATPIVRVDGRWHLPYCPSFETLRPADGVLGGAPADIGVRHDPRLLLGDDFCPACGIDPAGTRDRRVKFPRPQSRLLLIAAAAARLVDRAEPDVDLLCERARGLLAVPGEFARHTVARMPRQTLQATAAAVHVQIAAQLDAWRRNPPDRLLLAVAADLAPHDMVCDCDGSCALSGDDRRALASLQFSLRNVLRHRAPIDAALADRAHRRLLAEGRRRWASPPVRVLLDHSRQFKISWALLGLFDARCLPEPSRDVYEVTLPAGVAGLFHDRAFKVPDGVSDAEVDLVGQLLDETPYADRAATLPLLWDIVQHVGVPTAA